MRPKTAAAALAACALTYATSANAGLYEVSAPIQILQFEQDFVGFASLAKYSGPEKITSVTVTLTGKSWRYHDYTICCEDVPVVVPALPVSWALELSDNDLQFPIGNQLFNSALPSFTTTPPAEDYHIITPKLDVSIVATTFPWSLDQYAGPGESEFRILSETLEAQFEGVVTMRITTAVPEFEVWGLMLFGVAGAGGVLRRQRAKLLAAITNAA